MAEQSFTWPAAVFWLLIAAGTFWRGPGLLYVFTAAGAFGTLLMVPGELVGKVNILPQPVCAVFLVLKILLQREQIARAVNTLLDPARLGFLFLFLVYGLVSAYIMPRLFAHTVTVIPITATVNWPVALEPSSGNITQSAYLALSIGVSLAFALAAARPEFLRHYLLALLFGGFVFILTGVMDLVLTNVGLASLLEPFRNAAYTLHVDVESSTGKRVVGLMPEASAYGPLCVANAASLAFLRPLFMGKVRDFIVPAAVLGLLAMAALSFSSTAYVGIAVFGCAYALNWVRRLSSRADVVRRGLGLEALAAGAALIAFLTVLTLAPKLTDPVFDKLDSMLVTKTQSSSYAQRMMWNQVGIDAFFATRGIGAGLGSARSSSWYVAILSNTGYIGAALLICFILQLYLRQAPDDPQKAELVTGLKFALIPNFATAGLTGLSPDFGVANGALFGLIVSAAASPNASSPALAAIDSANAGAARPR
ncbi:MAG: hypothetical protein J2P49_00095 [Methylocapsa sp.]|nr:hypothetical protein [Methylocapsa sp.]